jgi:hypothetical protein
MTSFLKSADEDFPDRCPVAVTAFFNYAQIRNYYSKLEDD